MLCSFLEVTVVMNRLLCKFIQRIIYIIYILLLGIIVILFFFNLAQTHDCAAVILLWSQRSFC